MLETVVQTWESSFVCKIFMHDAGKLKQAALLSNWLASSLILGFQLLQL